MVVFHQMPYFLQHFSKKLGQNPSARYFAEKVAYLEEIDKFWWFFTKCPTFCNIFLKNWVKTLVHGTLQKKLLISRRSTSFGGFSPNALLFATFF